MLAQKKLSAFFLARFVRKIFQFFLFILVQSDNDAQKNDDKCDFRCATQKKRKHFQEELLKSQFLCLTREHTTKRRSQ